MQPTDLPATDLPVPEAALTPLSLRVRGRLPAEIDFAQLVGASLRRLRLLAGAPDEEGWTRIHALERAAREVRTVNAELRKVTWSRASSRQQRDVEMTGLVGRVLYEG